MHATIDPESILRRHPCHYAVRGEGEGPLLSILEHLEGRVDEEGLLARGGVCMKHGGRERIGETWFNPDLNALADVDYMSLPGLEGYLRQWNYFFQREVVNLPVLVARGCHWDCSFCINTVYKGCGCSYRAKGIEKIERESEAVIDAMKIRFVEPRDEDFFLDRILSKGWLEYAKRKGFLWSANGRYNYFGTVIKEEDVKEYVEGGLYSIGMSIEAGDEDARRNALNKRLSDRQCERALEMVSRLCGERLVVATSFMVDFPGDTARSRSKTIEWMDGISRRVNTVFSGPQVYRSYPGTPLYRQEGKEYKGDIKHYLDGLESDGTERSLKMKWSNTFYQEMLPAYFNARYKPLRLLVKGDGHPGWEVSGDRHYEPEPALRWLMLPVRLRLLHGIWCFFVEASALGWLYRRRAGYVRHFERAASFLSSAANPLHALKMVAVFIRGIVSRGAKRFLKIWK